MKDTVSPVKVPPSVSLGVALKMAWMLLNKRERMHALLVLMVILVAALFSAATVISIMPFLQVLSDPGLIETNPRFNWLYNRFEFRSEYDFVIALGAGTVAFIFVSSMIQILNKYAMLRFSIMRIRSLSTKVLSVYLRQPYEFFLNRHSGEMATMVLSEAQEVVKQFIRPFAYLVTGVMSSIAIFAAMIWVDPRVALGGFLVIAGSYVLIYVSVQLYLSRIGRKRVNANSLRFRLAGEALTGIKDVKVTGGEYGYLKRFSAPSQVFALYQYRANVIEQIPRYLIEAILFGGIIVVSLVFVSRGEFEDGNTLGGMLPVLGALALGGQKLLPEIQKVYSSIAKLRFAGPAVQRIYEDVSAGDKLERLVKVDPVPLGLSNGILFSKLTFRYPGADQAGITDLSLEIKKGERIGVVGTTGAGKSTFVDLLLGLLHPQAGQITVDNTKLDKHTARAWQLSIGYVPQEIFVTDSSIAENIAFGKTVDQIEMERVVSSAQMAQLAEFISKDLPQGYDTFIGERGVRLSGGQRQRLGIARALYHNPDVIVFDEATSALDTVTELDVMESIKALPGEKTIIMIAHRLSTVRYCDRILVLENGRQVGFGSWDELSETCLAFKRLIST